jgi:hypothetical protein
MPILEVTENWSAERLALRYPWEAYREFVVSGTSDATEALAATGVPQIGEGHSYNTARLRCNGPEVRERKGVDFWVIGCPYSLAITGDQPWETASDPLAEPAVVRWEHVEVIEPVDRDLGLRPILQSNGIPPSFQVARPVVYKKFTIFKNFPYYDLNLAKAYDNSVNLTDIALGMGINAAAQHLRCVSIIPATEYKATAEFIPMAFSFELISQDTLGKYPFQHRIMDQGMEGWYVSTGTNKAHARFSTDGQDGKEPVSSEIRLDKTGKPLLPMFTGITVAGDNVAVANPHPPDFYDTESATNLAGQICAWWLYYQKTRVVDMSPLLALL